MQGATDEALQQMQDSARSQRGKVKKEPTVYNVPEYQVPEDFDAAILGEVDLRDKTNAAHTLPTAFFERFNAIRQQVSCAAGTSCLPLTPCLQPQQRPNAL